MAEFIRIVRVRPNGTEQILKDIPYADVDEQMTQRAAAYAEARQGRTNGQHIRVYTSSNETVSPGDIVWDSEVSE